jgi:diguanylate cyclase (GGDEF)-like protein
MPEFTRAEAKALSVCVERFTASFQRDVGDVIARQFRGIQPADVAELIGQLSLLGRQLDSPQKPVVVHDGHSGLLKRVLVDQRREQAEAIDGPLQKAVDAQLIKLLRRDLVSLEFLMSAPWFQDTKALRVPALTDYLSIRHAEAALAQPLALAPREYDEKFHILEAPALFLPDLALYRKRAAFRGVSIAVAYLDIDDFKAFNTRYTETKVDLELLAPFMEAIEAHVFSHGHAYRFGGDEYVLTLPNMERSWAVMFLRALQARIAATSYRGIERGPTISIGLAVLDVDCFLTDREVQARANAAKNHAKSTEKGRIATFEGVLFRDADLALA